MAIVASDWQKGVSEEIKTRGSISLQVDRFDSHTDKKTSQPTFAAETLSGMLKTACQPPASFLFCSPSMTLRGSVGEEAMSQAKREFHG